MTLAWKRRRRDQVLPLCAFQPDALAALAACSRQHRRVESPNKDSCLSSGSFLALQERPASRRRALPRGPELRFSPRKDAF